MFWLAPAGFDLLFVLDLCLSLQSSLPSCLAMVIVHRLELIISHLSVAVGSVLWIITRAKKRMVNFWSRQVRSSINWGVSKGAMSTPHVNGRWTWYEAQEWDSSTRGVCHLFQSCGSRNTSCTFCYTGDRSCYRDETEQRVSAIIGGIFFETSINDVEVIEQSGHCKPGLVEDTPPEWVRWGHASATVGSSLYVCGGRDNFEIKNSCLRYDIVRRVWENDVSPMKFSRQGAKAVEAYGELYIMGGHNGTHALSSVEIFNYEDGTWRQLDVPMIHPRADHCTATHEDGIYALGGRSLPDSGLVASMEVFNITTGQWSELKPPNLTRADHSCAFMENGLLVAGGRDLSGNNIGTVDFFNLTNHQWQPMAEMVIERYAFGLTVMNDSATAVGGHNGVTALKSAEQYSMGMNEWRLLELELDNARSEFSITGIPLSLLPEGC
ncbi:hypothetical protein TCAL_07835 [Tigriopus californicus]|uniref:Attractin/MKLN-like beta-propeller domain-containing protein n=1 Tax=Tigriopus californicus TaxID=6832 RepID=A0A553PJJ5_TIGCA|nr:hypothetical protein TCAL_07835 [Tigriopus californicus]